LLRPRFEGLRLQRHATFGARAWSILFDLRVHWTGVNQLPLGGGRPRPRIGVIVDVRLWGSLCAVGKELLAAVFAAKVEGLAVPLGFESGRFIDGHAANGINRHQRTFSILVSCASKHGLHQPTRSQMRAAPLSAANLAPATPVLYVR